MFRFDRFEELRSAKGITKKFITDAIGRSSQTVQDWKNAKSEPNDSQIAKVANILGTSAEYLRGEVDQYGLSPSDWFMMGSAYKTRRILSGKKISEAVDGELLTEEQLTAFEETGEPLSLEQINTACGLIDATGPDVFAAWANNLYKEELPPIVGGQLDENSLEYAAHKYEGDITPEDKATIISLMKRFAEENKKGGGNGATD